MPRSAFANAASAVLLLTLTAPAWAATTLTFSNSTPITINEQGNASVYPSTISVSGVTNFTRLQPRLVNFIHTYPDDVDVILVGPQGQRAVLMSDAGGGTDANLAALIFSPTAARIPDQAALDPNALDYGTANYGAEGDGNLLDTFAAPGPGALNDAPADLSAFNGTNPNGTWNLFVVDDAAGDSGSIGTWRLVFTVPTVFTVTKTADTNDGVCNPDCSLREALALAQDGDLVNFSSLFNTPQTIHLLTALPDITRSITIQGTGANLLTVRRDFNAQTEFRILNVSFGVTNGVAISGMTITGGNAGSGIFGGGIYSLSHLTLTNVHVTGNTSDVGGGAVLALADGVFTNCTFSNNTSTNANGRGGGIFYQGDGGRTLRVINSTISGNRSANGGGGITNGSGSGNSRLEITNSTIAGNTALNIGGVETLTQGAGTTATTTLRNTIVASNSPNNLETGTFGGGPATFQTLGFNLSDNYNGVFTPLASDQISATPRLAPLALYGGQTPTHALLHASPAINAGDASNATTDQRGVARVFGAFADIGAVEMRPLVVTSTANGGAGSLFNILGGGGNGALTDIQFENGLFSTPQTITRTAGQLSINFNANILAPGANLLTISGNNNSRVFEVPSGVTATLSGMTITGGNGSGGNGGGIRNDGTLTLSHATVSSNTSEFGGGGGISGGPDASLVVSHSTISGNSALSGRGHVGGGIEVNGGHLTVTDSTLSGNSTPSGFENGAAISSRFLASVHIINSTITNNSTASVDSASGVVLTSGTLVVRNSIIARNINNGNQPDVRGNGTITSAGFNLIGNPGTGAFTQTGDQSGSSAALLDPLLGPLQNNGGTTNTHALLFGSPALDRGNSSGATRDQTGQTRPVDLAGITNPSDGADIGAFEAQSAPVNPAVAPTVTYTPVAGSTINFPTGTAGTATSSIVVNSSGGVAPGSVNVANCSAPAGFTITNAPINLTGTAGGAQINANINLSCTRGVSLQTGTLSCSETPTPGSAVARNWTLSCPAAAGDPIFGNGFEG